MEEPFTSQRSSFDKPRSTVVGVLRQNVQYLVKWQTGYLNIFFVFYPPL